MSKLVRWAKLLGIPPELLWFKMPADGGVGQSSGHVLQLPVLIGGRIVLLPIDESAARASGLDCVLDQFTDPARSRIRPADAAHAVHAPHQPGNPVQALVVSETDELERLAAVLDDARRYLGSTAVELFRAHLERGKDWDGRHGAAKALPLVLGILGAISEHVRDVKPVVRVKLLSLGADGAEFAGWLYRDLKDMGNATYWYDRAMEWAHEASDLPMQGYVLLRKSQMAYDTRDAHRVVTFAEAACQGPWRLSPSVQAEAAQQQALGLAMTGSPIGVVEEHMAAAQNLLTRAHGSDGEQAPGAVTLSVDTLMLRQAACYTEAGKPAKAVQLFDRVLASGDLSKRDAGFFSARRAVALALSGEPDEAAAAGLKAVAAARETSSERTMGLLNDVVQALRPWSSRPRPAELRHAVLTSSR